jgi:hypothetical protein
MLTPPYVEHSRKVLTKYVVLVPVLIPHALCLAMKLNRVRIMLFVKRMRFTIVDRTTLSHLTLESQQDEGWGRDLQIRQDR